MKRQRSSHARIACLVGLFLVAPLAASAATFAWTATFAPESSGATGSGSARVTIDTLSNLMRIEATFSGLSGTSTVAHIHCCTATAGSGTVGVATATPSFPGWPAGVTAGSYDQTFDTTATATFNAPFVGANGGSAAGALAALIDGMNAGRAYFNVHSSIFLGGEIRGFLAPVPEPGVALLLGLGLALLSARGAGRH
jgi:hypothetical protein